MKPKTCSICGSSWLADHVGHLSCLGCGAVMGGFNKFGTWGLLSNEQLDAKFGPVCLTRRPLLALSNEQRDKLVDDLGFGGTTP